MEDGFCFPEKSQYYAPTFRPEQALSDLIPLTKVLWATVPFILLFQGTTLSDGIGTILEYVLMLEADIVVISSTQVLIELFYNI